ncbi:5-formyltetrahydrofolate cyclo-ligase [Chitinophaga nivalis]|uniref:5-formyltetrahydrofolate cyclo-ligase n=1 Tax=Chitinophaga nivalis TaxID=2991709 RepID=A0ABT3ILR7_9BACT|nr:5-formyltetrahydrofolate cyclo-ligase [Chitinophaga nivalis]MCW3465381.1 5-formyltetrahydrofolate cyclo-ligase [Chitinophaga nivalis]MCW3484927.1 5-formyltetrahydrofolate cyclo-ligase [Chitinophaga nivalis]
MTTKKDIRKHFLEERLNLDDHTIITLNEQLLANCRQLDFQEVKWAHVFLPISEKKEVNTWPLVNWLKTTYPGIQWALSRANMKTGEMTHYHWEANTILVKNRFGIPEPAQGTPVIPSDLDLVFVPLLAFDRQGHRVGYGKGMYDRFLKECRSGVRTIGLSLFEPVARILDTDPWDVPLQTVVTPGHIYHF